MPRGRRRQSQVEFQREALDRSCGRPENECVVRAHLVAAEAQPVGDRGLSGARHAAQTNHTAANEDSAGMEDLATAELQDEGQNPAAIGVSDAAPRCARVGTRRYISLPLESEGGNAGDIDRPGLPFPVSVDARAAFLIPPHSHGRAKAVRRKRVAPAVCPEVETHRLDEWANDRVLWAFEPAHPGRARG